MVPSWQGVGLGEDLVFAGLRSAHVMALHRDTGELAWNHPGGQRAAPGRRGRDFGADVRPPGRSSSDWPTATAAVRGA